MNAQDTANAWSGSGYVTEIPYTRDYMRYQAPINMAFAAAANGFEFPDYKSGFRYCDLGCGEAITTLCLAAAYPHAIFMHQIPNIANIQFLYRATQSRDVVEKRCILLAQLGQHANRCRDLMGNWAFDTIHQGLHKLEQRLGPLRARAHIVAKVK